MNTDDITELFKGEKEFIRVASQFYLKNFGTMTKSEIELMMFTILYEKLNAIGAISDVSLAFSLGISVKRVDALIEKMIVKMSEEELSRIPWRQNLSQLVQRRTVSYDSSNNRFCITINDFVVFYKAVEILKKYDVFYEEIRNPQGLILSEEAFVVLAYNCCDDVNKKKSLEDVLREHNSGCDVSTLINGKSFGQKLQALGSEILLSTIESFLSDEAAKVLREIVDGARKSTRFFIKKR